MAVVGRKIGNGPGVNRKASRQRWGSFYCSLVSCDKKMTVHVCAMMSLTVRWGSSYCSLVSCDKWMTDGSGDFDDVYLFFCLFMFVDQAYKGQGGREDVSFIPLSFLRHYHHHQLSTMSSPSPAYTSFLFSYREDGPAPDIVESMEEVGGSASLSLN